MHWGGRAVLWGHCGDPQITIRSTSSIQQFSGHPVEGRTSFRRSSHDANIPTFCYSSGLAPGAEAGLKGKLGCHVFRATGTRENDVGTESSQTLRWREMDSNPRSRPRPSRSVGKGKGLKGRTGSLVKALSLFGGPRVRIPISATSVEIDKPIQ
jgi:hypothetical protein